MQGRAVVVVFEYAAAAQVTLLVQRVFAEKMVQSAFGAGYSR